MLSWPAALHGPVGVAHTPATLHSCCRPPPPATCCNILPALQAKGKTSEAITRLCQLAPPTALLLTLDPASGQVVGEREVPTELVHRGDALKVGALACLPSCLPCMPLP